MQNGAKEGGGRSEVCRTNRYRQNRMALKVAVTTHHITMLVNSGMRGKSNANQLCIFPGLKLAGSL